MNESKPTCGWNEAKPSFPPDDQITESADNTLVRAAVCIADLARERDEARAEVARLREALSQADNWLQAWLKSHPCNHSALLTCEICEAREALSAVKPATDWFEVLVNILHCFMEMEGTMYQGYWKMYGVTIAQEKAIENAIMATQTK